MLLALCEESLTVVAVRTKVTLADLLTRVNLLLADKGVGSVGEGVLFAGLHKEVLALAFSTGVDEAANGNEVVGPGLGIGGEGVIPGKSRVTDIASGDVVGIEGTLLVGGEVGGGGGRGGNDGGGSGCGSLDLSKSRGLGSLDLDKSGGLGSFDFGNSRGLGSFDFGNSRGLGSLDLDKSRGLGSLDLGNSRGLGSLDLDKSRGLDVNLLDGLLLILNNGGLLNRYLLARCDNLGDENHGSSHSDDLDFDMSVGGLVRNPTLVSGHGVGSQHGEDESGEIHLEWF